MIKRSDSGSLPSPRRALLRWSALLWGVVAAATLVGCSSSIDGSLPQTPDEAPSASSTAWTPGGSADENLPAFTSLLQPLVLDDSVPATQSVLGALHTVGLTNDALQITPDHTPTNLDADNLTVSVRLAGQCLIGEYHRGRFDAVVAAPINDVCLVGNTLQLS